MIYLYRNVTLYTRRYEVTVIHEYSVSASGVCFSLAVQIQGFQFQGAKEMSSRL